MRGVVRKRLAQRIIVNPTLMVSLSNNRHTYYANSILGPPYKSIAKVGYSSAVSTLEIDGTYYFEPTTDRSNY